MEIWLISAFVAFFIKGLCGFANTLVFTTILGFGTNNIHISPVELVTGYPNNLILIWKNRMSLDKKIYLPLSGLVLLGSLPGAFLLKNVQGQYIKIVFGVAVIMIAVEMLLREQFGVRFKESKVMSGVLGLISGLFSGLFGVGAIMAAYVSRITKTSSEFKANVSFIFAVENTFRVFLYLYLSVITPESLKMVILILPASLVGLFLGMKSSKVLDEKFIKKLVVILLLIAGIVMIWKNL